MQIVDPLLCSSRTRLVSGYIIMCAYYYAFALVRTQGTDDIFIGCAFHFRHVTCPNCGEACEPLSPKDVPECIIDRCPSCEGFWLDKDELDELRDVVTSVHSDFLEDSKKKQETERQKQGDRSKLAMVLSCLIEIA